MSIVLGFVLFVLLNCFGSTFFFIILFLFFLSSEIAPIVTLGLSNLDKSIFSPVVVTPLIFLNFALIN